MKPLSITLLCVLSSIFTFGQYTGNIPKLEGSWEVTTADDLQDPSQSKLLSIYKGQKVHFLTDRKMVLESMDGYYIIDFEQTNDTLLYAGMAIPLSSNPLLPLRMDYKDLMKDTHFRLGLKQADPLHPAIAKDIIAKTNRDSIGPLSMDGMYYHHNKDKDHYLYIRFLPGHKAVSMVSSEAPDSVAPVFYANNHSHFTLKFANNPEKKAPIATQQSQFENPNKREGERILTYSHTKYYAVSDTLRMHKLAYDVEGDTIRNEWFTYLFYPSRELGYWFAKNASKQDRSQYAYRKLLLPQRISRRDIQVTETFKVVEEMPRFSSEECESLPRAERKKCADKKMLEYIYTHINYPIEAREAGIEGTGVVKFNIEKNGILTNIQTVRSLGYGIDEEMERVINKMKAEGPPWIPGKQRGRPVRVQYNLPIKFRL